MINPTYLTKHPTDLSPLARSNDENPDIVDRFQLVVNGQEIINGYSELVDSIEQEKRLIEQSELKREGDKRDQPSNRERTYKKMAGQFGSNFCPEINKKLQLTLADEAILNGENLVKILTNQI